MCAMITKKKKRAVPNGSGSAFSGRAEKSPSSRPLYSPLLGPLLLGSPLDDSRCPTGVG